MQAHTSHHTLRCALQINKALAQATVYTSPFDNLGKPYRPATEVDVINYSVAPSEASEQASKEGSRDLFGKRQGGLHTRIEPSLSRRRRRRRRCTFNKQARQADQSTDSFLPRSTYLPTYLPYAGKWTSERKRKREGEPKKKKTSLKGSNTKAHQLNLPDSDGKAGHQPVTIFFPPSPSEHQRQGLTRQQPAGAHHHRGPAPAAHRTNRSFQRWSL